MISCPPPPSAVKRVQVVENAELALEARLVAIGASCNAAQGSENAGRLRAAVYLVHAVDVVHDLADRSKRPIVQGESIEQRLERAVLTNMRVLGADHVETNFAPS